MTLATRHSPVTTERPLVTFLYPHQEPPAHATSMVVCGRELNARLCSFGVEGRVPDDARYEVCAYQDRRGRRRVAIRRLPS